jgi:hypothetical protein
MKNKLAYAIVSKKRPVIQVKNVYDKDQIKGIYLNKDARGKVLEEIIQVVISEKK